MMTKLKLALAVSGSLLAGVVGVASAQNWGGPGKAAAIQKYDTNGNGQIDPQERAAMRADFQAKREAMKQQRLAKYDTNRDGKLEPAERKVMRDAQAAKLFAKVDANKDGVITLDEFKQAEGKLMRHARHGRFGHHRGFGAHRGPGGAGPGVGGAGGTAL